MMSLELVDPELIARLTNQAIPVDQDQPIQVNDIREDVTWEYITVTYNSVWAEGVAIPLVLRHHRSSVSYWQNRDFNKCPREWAVLRRLRLDGFPAPRPVAQGEMSLGQYLIWQLPAGETWYRPGQSFAEQAGPIIPQLANLLSILHALDQNSLNHEPLYQATVAGTLVRMLIWSREIGSEALRQMVARLKPAVAGLESWQPSLLHGNPHLDNLLVSNGEITALLNWENAAIGDPRWDVMAAAYWLRQRDPALADQLVNWYETFTGKTIAERPFWWALLSVRLWALKAWVNYAIDQRILAADFAEWTVDLAEVHDLALVDLAAAGL
jgi:aminoglycoside phosphotransferase (APT) family kinase protein